MISLQKPVPPPSDLVEFPSWVNDAEAGLLMRSVRPGDLCIDVGVGRGKTTILMVRAGAANVYAVSNWDDPEEGSAADFVKNASRANVLARIRIYRMASVEAAKRFQSALIQADVILIDADHHAGAVWADFQAWRDVLKPGGVMLFHDVGNENEPGVERAVSRILWEIVGQVDTLRAYRKPVETG